MIIPNLEISLKNELQDATEIYIAVALIKDYGLRLIEDNLPPTCKRKYLVGIDLPTAPTVLYRLIEKQDTDEDIVSKLYTGVTYHPKVYIVKKTSGNYVAFIGSANATLGGLTRNKEMNLMLIDQVECKKLLEWFFDLFNEAKEFDFDYVKEYEETYKRNLFYRSAQKSNTNKLLQKPTTTVGVALGVLPIQFFKQSDFDALGPMYDTDDSKNAKQLRKNVWEKLRNLHGTIYPEFKKYGMTDLHKHYQDKNLTSNYYHVRGSLKPLNGIWLHYGKSKKQLGESNFTDACRLQLIIRNSIDEAYVGIWLYIGGPNKSIKDRENLKEKLSDETFCTLFYEYFLELGDTYWISINGVNVDELQIDNFRKTLLKDDYSGYYIIGRNYHPDDVDVSGENIKETVLVEFAKLYKLYKMVITV